ncbi:MAG: divalent-cation tolerance protein CutA [Nitrospiraceae bacterium]|nr:divalent-cation tolerance protein CutA [Nitrospiraceae bacterium]
MTKLIENIIVFITAQNEEKAVNIAKALVQEKLAGCVNIVKNIRSIYTWQDKIEDESEVLMIIKTKSSLFEKLNAKVKALHSYTVPEIIAIPIVNGSDDYLKWLNEVTD